MPDVITAEQFLTLVPLAIPAAVLLTLLAILIFSYRRRRRADKTARSLALFESSTMHRESGQNSDDESTSGALVETAPASSEENQALAETVQPRVTLQAVRSPPAPASEPASGSAPGTAAAVAAQPASPAQTADRSVVIIAEQIAGVEGTGTSTGLAELYLELARAYRADGRNEEAVRALRSSAGHAAIHGPRAVHGIVRFELGEVAFQTGDLTGACEQWQIAKTAFHDEGLKEAYAKIDKRMRDNGCPTDWVLTEF